MKHISYLIINLVLVVFNITCFELTQAREGDPDARGRIDIVTNGYFEIIVEGSTVGGPLWLGCTVIHENGREQDLEAKQKGKCLVFCNGEFKEEFEMPASITSGEARLDYIVALWRWKVNRSECTQGRNGGPCEWCQRNDYHLEDRVDIGRGTWSLSLEKEITDRNELREGQREAERNEAEEQARQEERLTFSDRLGARVTTVEVHGEEYVQVVSIERGSKADESGLELGDVIYRVVETLKGNISKNKIEPSSREDFDRFKPLTGSTLDFYIVRWVRHEGGGKKEIEGTITIRW